MLAGFAYLFYFYREANSMMKKLTILLVLFVELFVACNNSSDTMTNAADSTQQKKSDSTTVQKKEGNSADSVTGYTWSKADQNKFLKDCDNEFEENVPKSKRKDFCNCILTEGQKYYSSYKQMREEGDEDYDEEIGKCLAEFIEDEDE